MAYSLLGALALGLSAGSLLLLEAREAAAYSTDSVVSDPCHERMTMNALVALRKDVPLAEPIAPNRNERALIDDVPFDLRSDMRDLAAVTLILANREVDLKGRAPEDLDELATVHGNPNQQVHHCLRGPDQDEPGGSEQALANCRAYIRERVDAALDGLLDLQGPADPAKRLEIRVFLALRRSVDADLPLFWAEMGRALHAVQDGFSHTYRSPDDQRKVVAVLNYIDVVNDHVESRDGPPHNSELDRCEGLDAFRRERLDLATQASYEIMKAALEPQPSRELKLAAVDRVLAEYFTLDAAAGCTAENGWCDAPEPDYVSEKGCVCSHVGAGAPLQLGLASMGALALVLGARRRRSRRGQRRSGAAAAALLPLFLLLAPDASAQELPPSPPPGAPTEKVAVVDGSDATPGVVDASPVTEGRKPFPLGGYLAAGGSILNGAFAASAGLRYRLSSSWVIGLDGEYNPWFSMHTWDIRSGSTNVYAVGILRFPLRFQRLNLRSTLQLGVSRMNFDLYGVPKGSMGPFVGFNLLGIDVELSRSLYVVVDPAHVALPIPQTTGVPYVYPQYRFTIGFQFGA
ncbi:MAG TPA: hypothetical protein VI072_13350 [Polyangiaceae bacterium]